MKDGENHHHGKNEIIIVRRHKGDHDGHHGGAWKIAYADFMTAMMAFFLVMWLVNAANEETKASIASFFNPVELSDDTPAEKGLKKPADQLQGDHDKPKSQQQSDKDGGGVGGQDQTKPAMSGDDTSYSEADLFRTPMRFCPTLPRKSASRPMSAPRVRAAPATAVLRRVRMAVRPIATRSIRISGASRFSSRASPAFPARIRPSRVRITAPSPHRRKARPRQRPPRSQQMPNRRPSRQPMPNRGTISRSRP